MAWRAGDLLSNSSSSSTRFPSYGVREELKIPDGVATQVGPFPRSMSM